MQMPIENIQIPAFKKHEYIKYMFTEFMNDSLGYVTGKVYLTFCQFKNYTWIFFKNVPNGLS